MCERTYISERDALEQATANHQGPGPAAQGHVAQAAEASSSLNPSNTILHSNVYSNMPEMAEKSANEEESPNLILSNEPTHRTMTNTENFVAAIATSSSSGGSIASMPSQIPSYPYGSASPVRDDNKRRRVEPAPTISSTIPSSLARSLTASGGSNVAGNVVNPTPFAPLAPTGARNGQISVAGADGSAINNRKSQLTTSSTLAASFAPNDYYSSHATVATSSIAESVPSADSIGPTLSTLYARLEYLRNRLERTDSVGEIRSVSDAITSVATAITSVSTLVYNS